LRRDCDFAGHVVKDEIPRDAKGERWLLVKSRGQFESSCKSPAPIASDFS
jgi:hypothetical protein